MNKSHTRRLIGYLQIQARMWDYRKPAEKFYQPTRDLSLSLKLLLRISFTVIDNLWLCVGFLRKKCVVNPVHTWDESSRESFHRKHFYTKIRMSSHKYAKSDMWCTWPEYMIEWYDVPTWKYIIHLRRMFQCMFSSQIPEINKQWTVLKQEQLNVFKIKN